MEFKRTCPECGKELLYKNKNSCKYAEERHKLCRSCAVSGERNGFYGKTQTLSKETRIKMSFAQKRISCSIEGRQKHSKRFKKIFEDENIRKKCNIFSLENRTQEEIDCTRQKISKATSGRNNPMYGKPSPKGSGNGWSGWYKGIYFRSLLELSYLKYLIDNDIKFENAEQHKFIIEYTESFSGKIKNYFADFYLIDSQELIEVKPKKLISSKQNKDKFEAAKNIYGDKFKILTEKDINKLSIEDIKELYNNQEILFIERYNTKFKERYGT